MLWFCLVSFRLVPNLFFESDFLRQEPLLSVAKKTIGEPVAKYNFFIAFLSRPFNLFAL